MSEQSNPLTLLHPWQVALILGISERTLERYRARGTGAEYVRVGGQIRYSEPALLEYLRRQTVKTDQSDGSTEEPKSEANLKALVEELLAALHGDD